MRPDYAMVRKAIIVPVRLSHNQLSMIDETVEDGMPKDVT